MAKTNIPQKKKPRHGLRYHPLYGLWRGMRQRCTDPNSIGYANYGGRGIKVCERWDSFPNFLADMGPRPKGCTLDRIDNDKGYCPENCRWATRAVQRRNGRRVRMITRDGITLCVKDWEDKLGFRGHAIANRLKRGWTEQEALMPKGYQRMY